MERGAAVLKKAKEIVLRENAVVYVSPKKQRKRSISLDEAFEKEKKSSGKRKK